MKSTLLINKEAGMTPLQKIDSVRETLSIPTSTKISVAGRLDPMAEGLLLLLIGEENKNRKRYEDLTKEYLFSVVFGINTDSYDGMGLITSIKESPALPELISSIKKIIPSYIGEHEQPYPPFSSKPYKGKPLYYWARKQTILDKDIPTKKVHISSLDIENITNISFAEISSHIQKRIGSIHGNFRQSEILSQWETYTREKRLFPLITFRVCCSSGTYVRSIAYSLGEAMKTGAFAYIIKRTKIGELTADNIDFPSDK